MSRHKSIKRPRFDSDTLRATGIIALAALLLAGAALSMHGTRSTVQHTPPVDTAYAAPAVLALAHRSTDGLDTYAGDVVVSLCDTVSARPIFDGQNPVRLTIALSVLRDPGCAYSAEDEQHFEVGFALRNKSAVVLSGLTINDKPVGYAVGEQ